MNNIRCMFEPKSIAVIGASTDTRKIGYTVVNNILASGYAGKVYPVNPSGGTVLNLPVHKHIGDIEDDIDVVCTVIPAPRVFESVQRCAAKGVKYNLIITSGFSEVGNSEEEKKITAYSLDHGMQPYGTSQSRQSVPLTYGT